MYPRAQCAQQKPQSPAPLVLLQTDLSSKASGHVFSEPWQGRAIPHPTPCDNEATSLTPPQNKLQTMSPASSALLPLSAASVLQGIQQVAEELIPEEGEASRESSLQQAGGETLKQSNRPLLSHNLPSTVH